MAQAVPIKQDVAQAKKQAPLHEDDVQLKGYDPQLTRRLWEFAKVYRWKLLISVGLMLTASIGATAGPYLMGVAIDSGLGKG